MSNLKFTCSKTTAEADSEEIDQEIDREYDVADELQEEGAALRFYVDELADASEQLTALSTDRHQACFGDLEPPMTSHYLSELAIAALSESNSESLLQVLPARTGAEPKCPTYICPVACETTYDRMHAQDFSFLLQQISAAKLSDNFFDQIASTADDNFFDRPSWLESMKTNACSAAGMWTAKISRTFPLAILVTGALEDGRKRCWDGSAHTTSFIEELCTATDSTVS